MEARASLEHYHADIAAVIFNQEKAHYA